MNIKAANEKLNRALEKSARDHDGWPGEADAGVNGASCAVIKAVYGACGEAWMGRFNLHGIERGQASAALWKYKPDVQIYNFGCDFVLPAFDQTLVDMILERDRDYQPKEEHARIEALISRVKELGGQLVMWT